MYGIAKFSERRSQCPFKDLKGGRLSARYETGRLVGSPGSEVRFRPRLELLHDTRPSTIHHKSAAHFQRVSSQIRSFFLFWPDDWALPASEADRLWRVAQLPSPTSLDATAPDLAATLRRYEKGLLCADGAGLNFGLALLLHFGGLHQHFDRLRDH
jgi:hypothetical protein